MFANNFQRKIISVYTIVWVRRGMFYFGYAWAHLDGCLNSGERGSDEMSSKSPAIRHL
mgnify:CR=1 FL=1